ncbi:MAG: glucosaminidase domain-containing protein [Candidatus Dadabacteria bacterium]
MKSIIRILVIALLCTSVFSSRAQKKVVHNYISKYQTLAVNKMKQYAIPASIILGVAIVESDAGKSAICKTFKNHFGIVGKNSNSVERLGYKSMYREFISDSASFETFCHVIVKKKFYQQLKGTFDYHEWLKRMNEAKYAEAQQKWVNKIKATIAMFRLYDFDLM